MSAEPPTASIDPPDDGVLNEGIALVEKAEDSGDWKPVADWLARHPECGNALAEHLAAVREMRDAFAGVRAAVMDRAGLTVGGLELREEIGRGMDVVHRAFDPALNRDVAVKLLRRGRLSAADAARFRYEAEAAAGLDHPNVVPVLAFGEAAGDPYLVMPLMTGGSLAGWLRCLGPDRLLPADKAAEIVRDIALGVHHAHQHGLIHRDLKPGNVLRDRDGNPHVADFGLARPADATVTGVAGTLPYMAPEQARGEKHLTVAVDVHALGAILFELLTGGPPFGRDGGHSAVMRRVIEDPAPQVRSVRPDTPRDLEAVCLKCLEKRPEARYASARELADDLGRFLDRKPVTARPPGFWDWLRQLARTRPDPDQQYSWQVTSWFGAIFLAGGGTIFAMARRGAPAAGVWAVMASCGAALVIVLWWYMLRRFRQLPATERHSLILAVGHILAYLPLMIVYVPLSLDVPARDALGIFPPLAAVSGLGLFVLGSTYWSRFFVVGLGMLALAPVLKWYPESSPLIHAGAVAAVMWYWSFSKAGFRPPRRDEPTSPA